MKELFPGVYSIKNKFFTQNSVPGFKLFREQTIRQGGKEYAEWNPFHSKLSAALKNKLKTNAIKPGITLLYLGCAEGKTVQHLSNIIGKQGLIFGVDVSETAMKRFLELCEARENCIPILADATNPNQYTEYLEGQTVNVMFQDIAQKNQAMIFNANGKTFLKKGGVGIIAIKARSINQQKKAKEIFKDEIVVLKKEFDIVQEVSLAPYEKDHMVVLCRKK